ncbi:hypothetical protein GCM10010317_077290 [Streptomyces mirabilis]|uniref:hypothetical protein n=1 Tax=Streptomyces mirabilis TaxID=68239 RepID=UPI00167DFB68|nr:hypothetical protein [Streptomyces mirabilis]GHD70288.1 hypothetical protein GCM10010317_077290 [Streptomyces mirabilis]
MNATLRRIAVSGSAAVALLGGAAAITTASAPSASAAEMQTVINQATGAPVNMPDGRVIHVRGMDAAAYKASPEQHSVIVQAAAKTDGTDPAGISNGLTADGGQGAAITNPNTPVTGVQTGYNQQVTTQSAGGYIAAGVVGTLLFGAIAVIRLRSNAHKGDAVLFLFLGVGLGGTAFGTMIHQITTSGVGSLGGVLGGL